LAHYLQSARASHRHRAALTADNINNQRAGKGVGSLGAHAESDVNDRTHPIGSFGTDPRQRDGQVRGLPPKRAGR
jgi:hypothetical protein